MQRRESRETISKMTLAIVCITPNIPGSISWRAVLTVDRLSELVNQITDTLVEMQNGDEVEEWWFARENDWNEDSFFFFFFSKENHSRFIRSIRQLARCLLSVEPSFFTREIQGFTEEIVGEFVVERIRDLG